MNSIMGDKGNREGMDQSSEAKTLEIPETVMTNNKGNFCVVCKIVFMNSHFLNLHMKVHAGNNVSSNAITEFETCLNGTETKKEAQIDISRENKDNNDVPKQTETENKLKNGLIECRKCKKQVYICLLEAHRKKCETGIVDVGENNKIAEKRRVQKVCRRRVSANLTKEAVHTRVKKQMIARKTFKGGINCNSSRGHPQYICGICNKVYQTATQLKAHILIHTNERPVDDEPMYMCGVCEKRFQTVSQLKTHMLIHTNDKPVDDEPTYLCGVCKKRCQTVAHLMHHMLIHKNDTMGDEEPKYECCVCRKQLKTVGQFKAHLSIHTDEGPFKCDLCARKFECFDYLKTHITLHYAGYRPDKCRGNALSVTAVEHVAE